VTKARDLRDHGLPVEGLLLHLGKLLEFAGQGLQFGGQFLAAKL
jgi:hypothetical protein